MSRVTNMATSGLGYFWLFPPFWLPSQTLTTLLLPLRPFISMTSCPLLLGRSSKPWIQLLCVHPNDSKIFVCVVQSPLITMRMNPLLTGHRPSNISEIPPPQHAQDSTCHFLFQLLLKTWFSSENQGTQKSGTVHSQQAMVSCVVLCKPRAQSHLLCSLSLSSHTAHLWVYWFLPPKYTSIPLLSPTSTATTTVRVLLHPRESCSSCPPSPASIAFCSTMLLREIFLKFQCAHDLYLLSAFSVVQSKKE